MFLGVDCIDNVGGSFRVFEAVSLLVYNVEYESASEQWRSSLEFFRAFRRLMFFMAFSEPISGAYVLFFFYFSLFFAFKIFHLSEDFWQFRGLVHW